MSALPTAPAGQSPLRLGGVLLVVSFSTVLFTLAVWKLLAFFIMPSLFFDLLFVGFPLGAVWGVRKFGVSAGELRKTLWILAAAMVFSVAACLICKHADYLRAHLFEVELVKLIGQMATFTLLFLPFFCAYGLSEYVGYQLGTALFGGKMRFVYATYLFGAAAAYVALEPGLRAVGITGVLTLSCLLVLGSALLLEPGPRSLLALGGCGLLAAAGFFVWPGAAQLETGFLDLYKSSRRHSTHEYVEEKGFRPTFQEWGKYSLTEILTAPDGKSFAGFYNDLMQWEFNQGTGFAARMLGALPIELAPPGGRICIIGAGGGRQVAWAQHPRFHFAEILALELEPAVFRAVRGPLREEFGSVYEAPNVKAVRSEARGYMERTSESFDLIFLPSVGGYPQMMLEPGNMIRTFDAYRTLRNRLSPRGVIAIWYPSGLDPVEVLTRQYVRTLGSQGLGLQTRAYRNLDECLILATGDQATKLPEPEEIDRFFAAPDHPGGLRANLAPETRVYPLLVLDDPDFKPITDEQPFLAGNVRHIFSLEQLYILFGVVGGFLVALGVAGFLALRRAGDPGIPGRSYTHVAALSVLLGANFIVLEHFVILALFRKLYIFQDALALGAVSFLVVSGLGSALITERNRTLFQVLGLLGLLPVLFLEQVLSPYAILALLLPVAFATGSFFPAVFEQARRNPLAVFAMDALGAALGSAVSFFIPIAFGFRAFFPVGAALYVLTALATRAFLASGAGGRPDKATEVPAT